MGEKTKPSFVFLLRKPSKRNSSNKLEVFNSAHFGGPNNKYRLRVNGKWFRGESGKEKFFFVSKYEIRDMLWKSIKTEF